MRLSAGAAVAGAAAKATILQPPALEAQASRSGRKIRFASIGTGIRGCDLLRSARKVPTGELVATADLYEMHRKAGLEAYGADVPTSGDYRPILDRKDVDAVIVAVSDHLHRAIVVDCLTAGKDVYCEKPMSHNVADGFAMVEAVKANKRIFQAGSQRVSNIVYRKAQEIYASGRLGEVTYIEGHSDRNSPSGAWVYPIPPDASEQNIDWKAFLRDAPERPFDAVRFFRWRCFADYGEGVAGDLFVHLLSGIQCVSGINRAPERAQSIGSLTYFKDGRDFPDLLATLYEYDGVTLNLHCNQNSAQGEPIVFYGKEATMTINGNSSPSRRRIHVRSPRAIHWTDGPPRRRNSIWTSGISAHPAPPPALEEVETYSATPGYDDTADHLANFFSAVDTRQPVVENEIFGNHAAIACHMANYSYFHRSTASWDADTKTIKG